MDLSMQPSLEVWGPMGGGWRGSDPPRRCGGASMADCVTPAPADSRLGAPGQAARTTLSAAAWCPC